MCLVKEKGRSRRRVEFDAARKDARPGWNCGRQGGGLEYVSEGGLVVDAVGEIGVGGRASCQLPPSSGLM